MNSPEPAAGDRLALFVDLTDRAVLVVGAGRVGTRRVRTLLSAGARVHVVAPRATEEVRLLARAKSLRWSPREFVESDLADVWLVHIATGDRSLDAQIATLAGRARIWSVQASDHKASQSWIPAMSAMTDGIQVAVTASGDPRRASQLRDEISELVIEGTLIRPRSRLEPSGGKVWLVGAGPGDPDLMAVRARRVLRTADVVLIDQLIPAAILDELAPEVEILDVGKRPGDHAMPQEQINALLLLHASTGKRVVRLKGGDPLVFGRGGEEALECIAAGIPVEVVPGITSAIAVPAAAGIPVTHRGVSNAFLVISGHLGWSSLQVQIGAFDPARTVVILMGMRVLGEIASGMIEGGFPAQTPIGVVSHGWTSSQQTVVGTLESIEADVAELGISSPAIIVVGQVAALRADLGDLGRASANADHPGQP